MKTIHLLPDSLIAQIAAGEVIERPAFAVKELIENAIDAQATRIQIEITDSGLEKIIVTDNGVGMNKEDLAEACKLHTTSKIALSDSILSFKSLGFRGEALASIAAVSIVTIESKTTNDVAGNRITITRGEPSSIHSIGMPVGTRVVVEKLFHSLPARKNFLKSKRTEMKHIINVVISHILSSPNVGFRLIQDNKLVFDISHLQTYNERIISLFGTELSENVLPVTKTDSYVALSGYVVTPQISSQSIPKQYLSINSRPVQDKHIQSAIRQAYDVSLSKDAQPSWFISLTIPYEYIDVNIHPRKEFVEFMDTGFISKIIEQAVEESLKKHNLMYEAFTPQYSSVKEKITTTYLGKDLKKSILPWNQTLLTHSSRGVTQIHNLYILISTEDGLILIDQHAAHERILYEQFLNQFLTEKNKNISIPLSTPILLTISHTEQLVLDEHLEQLASLGFIIEFFSGLTYNITSVPLIFKDRNIKKIIIQLLSEFNKETYIQTVDSQSKKLLAYLSCRAAVKSGDPLTEQQMKDIVKELDNIPEAVTCPHGRPLKVYLSLKELNKMFKRK